MVIIISHSLSFISHSFAQVQSGKASYYAKSWTGHRTSNGERLHHDSMTCAHKTYPFGTLLKVTNLSNGMEVVVRVTDRGPYRKGRIIDLSWGAAKAIGMLSQGITSVRVEKVNSTNIPFKLEEENQELPLVDFEIADISVGTTPIWQDADGQEIDNKKVQRQMRQAVRKASEHPIVYAPATSVEKRQLKPQPAPQVTIKQVQPTLVQPQKQSNPKQTQPVPAQTKQVQAKPVNGKSSSTNVLEEINNKPNNSKAYRKREGKD